MLKIQYTDKRKAAIWLVNPEFSIGSAADNDLVIKESNISGKHISFAVNDDCLTVAGVTGNTEINGETASVGQTLSDGDCLAIGGIELEILSPASSQDDAAEPPVLKVEVAPDPSQWRLVTEGDWLGGKAFAIKEMTSLGRDASCDITIPGKHLSRRHATLAIKGNQIEVKDLGSINGTFINGERIQKAVLNAGDAISFDVLKFRVEGPVDKTDPNQTMMRPALDTELEPSPSQAKPQQSEQKRWKTNPTSAGNRDKTEHVPAVESNKTLWLSLIAVSGLVAAVWFLL